MNRPEIICSACQQPIDISNYFLAQARETEWKGLLDAEIDRSTIEYFHNQHPCSTFAKRLFDQRYERWRWDNLKDDIPDFWSYAQ